jgi:CIC family chloride channel protein
MPQSPAPVVIVGMMALFGGIAHAPLAVMLMVAEMTGNLSMLAPAMVAVGVSTALVGDTTIYRSQLPNRASAPAHRVRFSVPLLSTLVVRDAMTPPREAALGDATVADGLALLRRQGALVLTVVDHDGRFVRTLTRPTLTRTADPSARLESIHTNNCQPFSPNMPLDVALERLAEYTLPWLPVVTDGHVVGGLGARDALRAYRLAASRANRVS